MKTDKKILLAFILNFVFSIFEFFGGVYTGSIAVISDALHDLGDSISIGISYFLEKISQKAPNGIFTYGYKRYSVLGGFITTIILVVGSVTVIVSSTKRFFNPADTNYTGMMLFATVGITVNLFAALVTKGGHSLNQRAINMHIFEDVLGWVAILAGAILMKFTNFSVIDPLISIGVGIFILAQAVKNLKEVSGLFLMKTPNELHASKIENEVLKIEGVADVHHIHLWSIDGENHVATLHVVTNKKGVNVKEKIRKSLQNMDIYHVTIEIESTDEKCFEEICHLPRLSENSHRH